MQPTPRTCVARLSAPERDARRIADALTEMLDPTHAVCASVETAGRWQVEVHFVAPLGARTIRAAFRLAAGRTRVKALRIESAPARDWIAASLAGLAPVQAGRFVVHGAHDRARVPVNRLGIEIEAALAFGTGHHGTTRGCLLALDAEGERRKPRRVLDLGTGSGVLAIAAAKRFRAHVLATDIDARAIGFARTNAANNHVGNLIQTVRAAGFNAPELAPRRRFDLVLANILLDPLQRLAMPIALRLEPGCCAILSGLLPAQSNAAIAAYRARGLALKRRLLLDGWMTLVMERRAARPH